MGNSQASSYAPVAVAQWYLQGIRLYGARGCEALPPLQFPSVHNSSSSSDGEGSHDRAAAPVRHALVTGANSGIGLAVSTALSDIGFHVHMICRNEERGEEAARRLKLRGGKIQLHVLDLAEFSQVRMFAAAFNRKVGRASVIVNNAGAMPSVRTLTSENNEAIFACMLGGTHLLTSLLLPSLEAAAKDTSQKSRIINVSSAGMLTVRAKVDDLNGSEAPAASYDPALTYALAKRAQVCLTEIWARKLADAGLSIVVNSMHPGWADTRALQEGMPSFHEKHRSSLRTPEQGADTIIWLAASNEDDDPAALQTGKFFFDRRPVKTHFWGAGTRSTPEEYDRLWENANLLTGRTEEEVGPQ